MAAHKNVLLRLEVRRAGRLCYCKHNKKHAITKGDLRLVVKESGPGTPEYGYCVDCARAMLAKAEGKLDNLRGELD